MTSGVDRIESVADARRELVRLKQDLDDTYRRYGEALRDIPIGFQGDVHRYMCIRLSGYLEQLFFCAITGYLKSTGNRSGTFGLSFFSSAPNLKPSALLKLVGRFGDEWLNDLEVLLDDGDRRGHLGTLLAVRNKTAHGQNYRGSAPSVATYKSVVDDIHRWVLRTILNPIP